MVSYGYEVNNLLTFIDREVKFMQERKIMITFAADKEMLAKVKELQLATETFSRSEIIRKLVDLGLQSLQKDGQAVG